jgi:glucose-1-phosphate thymidylyltransferase
MGNSPYGEYVMERARLRKAGLVLPLPSEGL